MRRMLLTLTAAALVFTAGCGQTASAAESTAAANSINVAVEQVYGKIKEINGNEILLALGSYGGDGAEGRPPDAPDDGAGVSAGEEDEPATEGTRRGRGSPPADGGSPPEGAGERSRPEGAGQRSRPEGAGEQGGMPGGARSGGGGNFRLSGEERTVMIPVTATVSTGQGENAKEIRFTQLAVKNVVCLGLDAGGEVISVSVLE